MTFLWPQLLWLLWALPVLVLAYAWLLRRRRRLVLRYASLAIVRQAVAAGLPWRRHVPPALVLLALTGLLLAAARPLAVVPLLSDRATVMLAMDVSLSMLASDIKPSRLAAAQAAAKVFLQQLPPHVQVGIVTFAGTAQVVQPATRNRADLVAAIDRFQLQRGTAVGSSIVVALSELFPDEGIDLGELTYGTAQGLAPPRGKSLDMAREGRAKKPFVPVPPGSYTSAAVVLLTDGRNTTGLDPMQAAEMAAQHGVRVYAVGLGTVDGGAAGLEGWSAYLRLDEPMLQAIAQTTQGRYFQADSAQTLRQVYEQLGTRLEVDTRETEIAGLLALGALAMLLAAGALSLWWRRRSV